MLYIVAGASGVGKSTLCNALLDARPTLSLSVSYTTRPPRGQELDGVHYHFVDRPRYDAMVAEGAFAESAEVHGNGYGTARETVDAALGQRRSLLFDIDVQGAEQLRSAYPHDTVLVMILPPSWRSLEERLRGRGTDSETVIRKRLENARAEMEQAGTFDYLVVNDDVEDAQRRLIAIFDAAESRPSERLGWMRDVLNIGVALP